MWLVPTSQLIILFLTLLLFDWNNVDAIISNRVFNYFCEHMIELPGGLPVASRVGDESCTQQVPAYNTDLLERIKICKKYGPFEVVAAEEAGKSTKCVWVDRTKCEDNKFAFMEKCIVKTRVGTFKEVDKMCDGSMITIHSRYEARWLLLLFASDGENVWVANNPQSSRAFGPADQTLVYSRSNYDYDKKFDHVSIIGSPDFEIMTYSGMLIPTNPEERLVSFCGHLSTSTVSPPVIRNPNVTITPPATIPQPGPLVVEIDSSLTVFLTGPFTFNNIQSTSFMLDTSSMDTVCQKFHRNAFAVSPTKLILDKLGPVLTHPVFIMASMTVPAAIIDDCRSTVQQTTVIASLFRTKDENEDFVAIDLTYWKPGFPKAICSKHSPVAVVVNQHGQLENFPSSARLPLVCGIGTRPSIPQGSKCPQPNSQLGADNKCQCVSGTVDYCSSQTTTCKYPLGYYCVAPAPATRAPPPPGPPPPQQTTAPPPPPTTKPVTPRPTRTNPYIRTRDPTGCPHYTHLFFAMLLDESGSIERHNWDTYMIPFVRKVIMRVPGKNTHGGISRFAGGYNTTFLYNWDPIEILKQLEKPWLGGLSYLDYSVTDFHTFIRENSKETDREFTIVTVIVSDANITNYEKAKADVVKLKHDFHNAKSTVIVFSIGNDVHVTNQRQLASDPHNDVFTELKFENIEQHFDGVFSRICHGIRGL